MPRRPKNSKDYWKWRQARRMYEQMEDVDAVSADIARLYARASQEINKEIEKIFTKYQSKWGLTEAEAMRLLEKVRDKKTTDMLKDLVDHLADSEARAEFEREYEAGAYGARMRRFDDLLNSLDELMVNIYEQDVAIQDDHYHKFARDSYNREIFEIQQQVGFSFSFSEIPEKTLDSIIARKWCGESFSDAIWDNTQALANETRDLLLLELMTGKKQEDCAREIAAKMGKGAFQSRRVMRTESNYVSGQVQMEAYKECDAERYMYVATLDSRTDEECGMHDGKIYLVKDAQPGTNMNPMHPFCRCTTTIYMDEDTMASLERRAVNPVTGEREIVPAATTWDEWRKQFGL